MSHDPLAMIEYRSDPAIFIWGDSAEAVARWRDAAEAAALPVRGAHATADAGLPLPVASVPLAVELDGGSPALLDRLRAEAEAGRQIALAAPAEAIDLACARAWHANIRLSSAPSMAERLEDIRAVAAPEGRRLRDVGRDGDDHDLLRKLSEDVGRIAATLADLAEEPAAAPGEDEDAVGAATIRAIIRARRLRATYFPAGLFADPAWDMLLDLMAARLEGRPVAVSSLCIAAAVPATTALRWIRVLTDRGLLVRVADPRDGRRVFIDLSEPTARSLVAWLRAARRLGPPLV